ncbi:MAG: Fmu (Sun) domain-containing protein [Ginsengibacter sp.]
MMQTGGTLSSSGKGNHFHRYLQYADTIVSSYKGNEPFHLFLKKYFSLNKKHGSKDRKTISSLCYNYFRLGHGVMKVTNQTEKFLVSTFVCQNNPSLLLEFFKPAWNSVVSSPLYDKLSIVRNEFNAEKLFPFPGELSSEIDIRSFSLSFLIQPKLFIRIRPGYKDIVIGKIKKANVSFEEFNEICLSFSNTEKVSDIVNIDKEAIVQDYNSLRTLELLNPIIKNNDAEIEIWDCCGGSGGKSILAFDIFKNINLTVSDKRKNILDNLRLRFSKAGITNYKCAVIDLENTSAGIEHNVDLIIADVPCTGSGTWARTPEQLIFFRQNDIDTYASLQKKIIENSFLHLKSGGYLLYITCSVFAKENEENVVFIQQKLPVSLIKMEYLKGYKIQADTLFVALFKKS